MQSLGEGFAGVFDWKMRPGLAERQSSKLLVNFCRRAMISAASIQIA